MPSGLSRRDRWRGYRSSGWLRRCAGTRRPNSGKCRQGRKERLRRSLDRTTTSAKTSSLTSHFQRCESGKTFRALLIGNSLAGEFLFSTNPKKRQNPTTTTIIILLRRFWKLRRESAGIQPRNLAWSGPRESASLSGLICQTFVTRNDAFPSRGTHTIQQGLWGTIDEKLLAGNKCGGAKSKKLFQIRRVTCALHRSHIQARMFRITTFRREK